ncbi:MAG: hypothetical protein P1U47_05615 [Zhongshania sp.]|uniref:hypothetical protein n=1 Tax=Zhongshania sp. TaxID=1971902 RepID=UPI00260CAC8D|nr:hypothetical protein [Zhongshania sp.]MDF1691826.1 hypothetical protein [Zhongshania sp.]
MNSKMVYSLTTFVIAVYAIAFLRSPPANVRDDTINSVNWQIVGDQLAAGPQLIKQVQGQTLHLIVQSTRVGQLQLQGYDETLQLTENTPQELTVRLDLSGRFRLILLPQEQVLGIVEVSSK